MKSIKFLIPVLLGIIVCASCHDKHEWQEFEPFIVKSCSIPLTCEGFTANGTVSSEATSIEIETDLNPMINSVKLNSVAVRLDFYGIPLENLSQKDNLTVAAGEWGTLEYLKNDVSYSIKLNLSKNDSSAPRVIEIGLTGPYRKLDIKITQESSGNSL